MRKSLNLFIIATILLGTALLFPLSSISAMNIDLSVIITGDPHCNDLIDNDGDALIDYPNDPGCSALSDENEIDPPLEDSPSDDEVSGTGNASGSNDLLVQFGNTVFFRGVAYPGSRITLLKDGQFVVTTKAGSDAVFEIELSGLFSGIHVFGIWATGENGHNSAIQTFTLEVVQGITLSVSGIVLPLPDLVGLEQPTFLADVNQDGRVDLVDFSILAFWYKKSTINSEADLNSDGVVDMTDFSILAFYWTG